MNNDINRIAKIYEYIEILINLVCKLRCTRNVRVIFESIAQQNISIFQNKTYNIIQHVVLHFIYIPLIISLLLYKYSTFFL